MSRRVWLIAYWAFSILFLIGWFGYLMNEMGF